MRAYPKSFILLIASQIISIFGNAILSFALPLYILDISGSASLFGLVVGLSFIPFIIMGPMGGIIADRVRKQRMMFWLDAFTVALILAYIVASGFFTWWVIPIAIIKLMGLNAVQGLYMPVVQSSIPSLVGVEKLMPANAAVNTVNSLSNMLGPAIGGILYGAFGLFPVLVAGVICFSLAAITDLFIRIPHVEPTTSGSMVQLVKSDISQSVKYMFKENPAMAKTSLVLFLYIVFSFSMVVIGLPVIITQYLEMSSELYGISLGIKGVGGLLGGILAGVLGQKLAINKAHVLLLFCSLFTIPMSVFLFADVPIFISYLVITAASTALAVINTITSILVMAFMQTKAPQALAGKVIAFVLILSFCAYPVGQIIFGVLFESIPPWLVVACSAGATFLLAIFSQKHFNSLSAVK